MTFSTLVYCMCRLQGAVEVVRFSMEQAGQSSQPTRDMFTTLMKAFLR